MAMLLTAKERLMGVGVGGWGISQLSPLHRNRARHCLDSGRVSTASRTTERKSEIYVAVSDKGRGSMPPGKAWAGIRRQKRKVSLRLNLLCIYSSELGNPRHLNPTAACTLFHCCNGKKKKKKSLHLWEHTLTF